MTIRHRITGAILATGYDSYEQKDQAVPYDLLYTIQIRAPFRNNLRAAAMRMLKHSMRHYQPYTRVMIVDDLGDQRGYDAFMETPSGVDTKTDVANRETNFNLTLRVEGELDLNDPVKMRAMTSLPLIRYSIK